MLDRRGGAAIDGITISADAWATFESLYLTKQRRTVKDCHEIVAGLSRKKGWAWPSYSAVRKRVARLWPACKADLYRLGERKWMALHAPKILRDKGALQGNQCVEVDHGRLDFWARHGAKRVRPWLTAIVDRASNLPVGWQIGMHASSDSLCLALRNAVKTYGAPNEVALDNGADMKSRSFGAKPRKWLDEDRIGGVFEQLGVDVHWCKPYSAWQKGTVESFMNVVHNGFDRQFKSYCGGSPQAKPQDVDRWCEQHFGELPTVEQVRDLFAQFVATYAERPSSVAHMQGRSPRQHFDATRIPKRTCKAEVLDVLLLKPTGPRAVTSKGVLFNGIRYTDPRLFSYQGKRIWLRSDPDDLSFVWACNENGKPLFIVWQNRVAGTAEDARRARLTTQAAKRTIRKARVAQRAALDDTVSGILRARREHYLAEAKRNEPKERRAVNVAPIRTPAADALAGEEATIRRENARRKAAALKPAEREKPLSWTDLADNLPPIEEPAPALSFADLYEGSADLDALDALDDEDVPVEAAG